MSVVAQAWCRVPAWLCLGAAGMKLFCEGAFSLAVPGLEVLPASCGVLAQELPHPSETKPKTSQM